MRALRILVLCGLLVSAAVSQAIAMGDVGFVQDTLIGKQAADFTLATVKGDKFNFEQYRGGRKAIILFWTTWCPHCRVALKQLGAVRKEIEARGIALVIVSIDEARGVVENYLARHQYDFDVVLDQAGTLNDPYQIIGVPTLVYVDAEGKIKSVEHSFSGDFEESFK
jgi:peroxiredoxin